MADYNVQYIMEFQDAMLSAWRLELCLKNGPLVTEPIAILGNENPVTIDKKNNEENKFTPIIESKCTIKYIVRSDTPTDPAPETFIIIENDDWLVKVYQDGAIKWKGFLEPGENGYPLIPRPFAVSMTATDFSFCKSEPMNQNDYDNGLFDYNYTSIGNVVNRTLFNSVGYSDCVLNILYSRKPVVIGIGLITDSLFAHMDAFYDFEAGPDFAFTALEKLARSLGARMFMEDGAYWLQFIEDIGKPAQFILQITPSDLSGVLIPFDNYDITMGNSAGDRLVYLNRTPEVIIKNSLKEQEFTYDLKAINQIKNFFWGDNTSAPYENWQSAPADTGKWIRQGTGSYQDPYRITVLRNSLLDGNLQTEDGFYIPVLPGQLIELHVKNKAFFTPGSPTTEDFELSTNIIIVLANRDTPEDLYTMDASGEWVRAAEDPIILFGAKPGKDASVTEILSKPIPSVPGVNLGIVVTIVGTTIDHDPPPGSSYYTELYPIFLGRFTSRNIQYLEKIVNTARYSYKPPDQDMFFLDNQDKGYSNNLFYFDGDDFQAIPAKNWTNNKNIDEIAVKQYGDEQAIPTISVLGTFRSNSLSFNQSVTLRDKDNIKCMLIRDKYNVKKCEHDIMCVQLLGEDSAVLTYTVTPVTANDKK